MTFFPERPIFVLRAASGESDKMRSRLRRGHLLATILHQTHTMAAPTQPSTTLVPPTTAADRLAAVAAAHLLPLRPLAAPPPRPSTDAATTTFTADSNGGAAAAINSFDACSPMCAMAGISPWLLLADRLDRGSTLRHGMGSSLMHADPRGGHPLRQDGLRAAFSQVCAPPVTTLLPACLPAAAAALVCMLVPAASRVDGRALMLTAEAHLCCDLPADCRNGGRVSQVAKSRVA